MSDLTTPSPESFNEEDYRPVRRRILGDDEPLFSQEFIKAATTVSPEEEAVMAQMALEQELEHAGVTLGPEHLTLLGQHDGSAIVVEDEEEFATLADDGPPSASPPASDEAARQPVDPASATAGADALPEAAVNAAAKEADKATPADATRPSGVENNLANIRITDDSRQRRIVIAGDPNIERRFLERLASLNKLKYQNGAPIINVSRAKAMEILREVAAEANGTAIHALELNVDRSRGLNIFRHQIDVVVVGNQAAVTKTLGELGDLLNRMNKAQLFKEGSTVPLDEHGRVQLQPRLDATGKATGEMLPVKLDGAAKLDTVLALAKDHVGTWNAQQQAAREARLEGKDSPPKEGRQGAADASGKAAGGAAGQGAQEKPHVKPNSQAVVVSELLSEAFARAAEKPGALAAREQFQGSAGTYEQPLGEHLIQRSKIFRDPRDAELSTLSPETRQTMLGQLAALAVKAESGDLGDKARQALDKVASRKDAEHQDESRRDPRTTRERLADWLAAEKTADPQFEAKLKTISAQFVKQGVLSEAQAERMLDIGSKEATRAGTREAATAATTPEQPAKQAAGKEASQPTRAETQADAAPTTQPRATEAQSQPAAAQDGAPKDAVAQAEQHAGGVTRSAEKPAAADASEITPKPPASVTDSVREGVDSIGRARPNQSLDDLLAVALKDGPAATTETQARRVIEKLEQLRGTSLSETNGGFGQDAAATLRRVRVMLVGAEYGQFGEALMDRAEALRGAVQDWTRQDAARVTERRDEAGPTSTSGAGAGGQFTETESAALKAQRIQAGTGADSAQRNSLAQVSTVQAAERHERAEHAPHSTGSGHPAETASRAHSVGAHDVAHTRNAAATTEHVATLYRMMGNPAGSFTRRDKTWNQGNVLKAAQAVAGLDVNEVARLSPPVRTTLAAYSAWMADAATAGRLPGFTSEEGRQLAASVAGNAEALIAHAQGRLPVAAEREVAKAERMVGAIEERQQKLAQAMDSWVGDSSRGRTNATALARDLVHAVYREPSMDEGYANYLLKNSAQLTPDAIRSLDPETKARAAVALNYLAAEVRNGAMGDFDSLSSTVKHNVIAAQRTADVLHESVSRDPGMIGPLTKARLELTKHNAEPAATESTKDDRQQANREQETHRSHADRAPNRDASQQEREAPTRAARTGGRDMDR